MWAFFSGICCPGAVIGGRGPLTPLGVYLTGPGRSVFPEASTGSLPVEVERGGGLAWLPFHSFAQFLFISMDGFLLTLDFRLGSEAGGEGIEEPSSPSGPEETEQASNASEELHMQCPGRRPVGADLCQGPGRVTVTMKSTSCQHSWRSASLCCLPVGHVRLLGWA